MIPQYADNQTFFSEEEPLFTEHQKKRAIRPLEPRKPNTLLFVCIGVIVICLVSAIGVTLMNRRTTTNTQVPEDVTPTPAVQTSNQIDVLMSELKAAAQSADPTVNSLPFPPVLEQIKVSQ